jgi:deoxyribodipyrimidine photo-lyase
LHHSLDALRTRLRGCGARLILRQGGTIEQLQRLQEETAADGLYWNHRYEPADEERERAVGEHFRGRGMEVRAFTANLMTDPRAIKTTSGSPYRVFTPFYRKLLRTYQPSQPIGAPRRLPAPRAWPSSQPLAALGLLPRVDWAGGIREYWTFGEQAALSGLRSFARKRASRYLAERDRVDLDTTSHLSPHLHFGELSPRQVWNALSHGGGQARRGVDWDSMDGFLRQLCWREFAHHLLVHFPHTPLTPLRPAFARMPWSRAAGRLKAWQRGETGYPIVDAAMRQLWQTGWMHNRARMIAASFLVKDLLIRWQDGAKWFWDTLVDADLANNTLGWQWVAGCGADAAPFFRIFNPVLQGRKFDPRGDYVRRYIPELARLPARLIHAPWEASASELQAAEVRLGHSYPRPIVDHAWARERALVALARIKT